MSSGRGNYAALHAAANRDLMEHQIKLGDCLGKGAFGSVYRALNLVTGQTLAVKQIHLSNIPKSEVKVIMMEIDLLKNLHHPNIVKYHGFFKTPDSLYIQLEYCENGSLHSICKNFGKFPENLVALYINQVLQGLLYLHEQGVIHRDIKGANILTTKDGLVKLADFGVATKTSALSDVAVVGSPYWMAPEVIELTGATPASDIWSVGCTVIELLEGRPPYHKLDPMPALFRIVNDEHPPLPEGASPAVRDFLLQCFQKDPNLRVSARKLLKHPWISGVTAKNKGLSGAGEEGTKFEDAVRSVQQWNEAIKSPSGEKEKGEIRGSMTGVMGGSPAGGQRTNLRAGVVGGVTMTPPKVRESVIDKQIAKTDPFRSPESSMDNNWDEFFSFDSKSPDLPAPKQSASTPKKTTPLASTRKPTPSPLHHRRSNLASYMSSHATPSATDEDDWDKDFEGGLTLRSPKLLSSASSTAFSSKIPPLPPLSPKKSSPRKSLSPPKVSTGNISDDNSKTIRPATTASRSTTTISSRAQSRKVSTESTNSSTSGGNTMRAVSPFPLSSGVLSPGERTKSPEKKRRVKSRKTLSSGDLSDDGYEDLIKGDESKFAMKINSLKRDISSSPRLLYPSDLKSLSRPSTTIPRSQSNLRVTLSQSSPKQKVDSLKRSYSAVEIQKFAEGDDEEDYSGLFDGFGASSEKSGDSEDGIEGDSLLLNTRLSNEYWVGDGDSDEEDPFAEIDEGFDEMDFDANIARDKHARISAQISQLVDSLRPGREVSALIPICDQIYDLLDDNRDLKSQVIASHGLFPILELLDTYEEARLNLRLLRILNIIIMDDIEVQESLCFMGGIPIVTKFAFKPFASNIRHEAAAFFQQICQTSTLTMQIFVSCRGLNVIAQILEEDYRTEKDLVLVGVGAIWNVFNLQSSTPKNEFCRIFAKSGILEPLSKILQYVLDDGDAGSEVYAGRIVDTFLLFSQADGYVKELLASRNILRRMAPFVRTLLMIGLFKNLKRLLVAQQVIMLKVIKNLSSASNTLETLDSVGTIELLADFLITNSKSAHYKEISNQVLSGIFNLCRLNKPRQEKTALAGMIPILQQIVRSERGLKEFALPILCDFAHAGKTCRRLLWKHESLATYLSVLGDPYWQVNALDAILAWAQAEAKVFEELRTPSAVSGIVKAFNTSKANSFENLLEPLFKLLRLSADLACLVAKPEVFQRILERLRHPKAIVRLNLLRILRTICDVHPQRQGLIAQYGLVEQVEKLAEGDKAVLVRELAKEIVSQGWMERSVSSTGSESRSDSVGSSFSEAWIRSGHVSSDGIGELDVPKRKGYEELSPPSTNAKIEHFRDPKKEKRNSSFEMVTTRFEKMSLKDDEKTVSSKDRVKERRITEIQERPSHARTNSAGVAVEEITLKPLRVPKRSSMFVQRGVSQTIKK